MSMAIVGCDVGGTFTDLMALDPRTGDIKLAKVPSTTDNQARGVLEALAAVGSDASAVDLFIHGTTVTTNALLERKLARCGLITTRGFRDILELGRRTRPTPYGLTGTFVPIIPRDLRLEVTERMDAQGQAVTPLDATDVEAAARELLAQGVEAVVIHFLHSYANPAHERRAAEIVRALWPNSYVTVGHEIVAEQREYERGVTAAVNGSIQPVLSRYVRRLREGLAERGLARDLLVMQGNGGTASAEVVAQTPVQTVMSGPASGVIAASYLAHAAGRLNVVTYDMGGTSTDVALIRDGQPLVSAEIELEYAMPLHIPMVDVHTVGAGGGSIASVNEAGLLLVGPQSAGAYPGPICFGRGGNRITITDANLLLGRLDKERLLAVNETVSLETIRSLMEEQIARPLGLSVEAAAEAVVRVANDRMAGAVRMVTLARGLDPRDFCLIAFGGAGPLHAAALARELAIPEVLVPPRPGLTNALGCLVADLRQDVVRTINCPLDRLADGGIAEILEGQIAQARVVLGSQEGIIERYRVLHSADMQFAGQSHVLSVALPAVDIGRDALRDLFRHAYFDRFQVDLPEIEPVLVSLRTAVIGERAPLPISAFLPKAPAARTEEAIGGHRRVWFDGGFFDTPVYRREMLPIGAVIDGPAILAQLDTTIVIEPQDSGRVDECGNIIISLARALQ
ncbi:hydantoinase/oxoprolinase family protein [Xanthobacter dioxanivorans]|uniref:Hydantoinase/oxoprolinase family protein n=2 Tax=Xanthobacter dioxanivorans TaxID=2528964 RepID=A0A974PNJ4_9HYPH|nr:hydantoinase/oxoprolinase family protein [Xanthobacter dioxanivorans]